MSAFKYKFSDLVGNQLNISLLKRSIENNTFRQFTIFSGVLGTGKSTCARISAMALTCENPDNGEPCCACPACIDNMKAFDRGIDSPYVRTVNAAKLTDKESVANLVSQIFDLQGGIKNRVFLIEEAHALDQVKGAQTMLLSEFDSIAPNVYVIFSTTKLHSILEELKSRAEIFTFSRLTDKESKQLLEMAADQKGYYVPDEMINLMVKQGRGIPRNLLKALDFTIDEGVNITELRAHLQVIDDAQLITLFESMISPQIKMFVNETDSIKALVEPPEFVASMKAFLVQVTFVIEGDIHGTFNKEEVDTIKSIFTRDKIYKIVRLFDNTNNKLSESDLDMLLLHIRMVMQSRNTSHVVMESKQVGAIEKNDVSEMRDASAKAGPTASVNKITIDMVRKYQESK